MLRERVIAATFGVALLFAADGTAQGQGRERAWRLIPVHELVLRPPVAERDLGRWWQLDSSYDADEQELRMDLQRRLDRETGPLSVDEVAELAEEILSRTGRDVDLWTQSGLGQIRVAGPVAAVGAFSQVVETLRSTVAPAIDLEVTLIRPPSDMAVTTRIGPELWGVLSKRGEVLWSGSTRMTPGWPILLEKAKRVPYVADYDVEVAQDARIADPRVRHLMDGVQLLVDVRRLPDRDDLLVFGDLRVADLESPISTRRIGASAHGFQDLPQLRETRCLFSGRVDGDSRLAVWSLGDAEHGEPFVLTVKASRAPMPEVLQPQFTVMPVDGIFASHGMRELVRGPIPPRFDGEEFFEDFESQDYEPISLFDFLGEEYEDDIIQMGDVLVATAGPAGNRQIVQLMSMLADELADMVEVDLSTEGHRIVMPCLSGRELIVTRGLHSAELWEYDVEIAGEEQVANPVTRRVFDGLHMRVRPGPVIDGSRVLRVNGSLIESGLPEERPLGADDLGALYVYSPRRTRLPWFGRATPGQAVGLGAAGENPDATITVR